MTINKTVVEMKAEWNRICNAMDRGHWHGSEQSAIDAIEDIKRKIQAIESTPIDRPRAIYGASYRMHGERYTYQADSSEELEIKIFGQSYAPSRESITYWQEGVAS
tara:strand:- start:4988 stop:5305 length:318 start_codon:yes stop_codon:yes gene_type:complete